MLLKTLNRFIKKIGLKKNDRLIIFSNLAAFGIYDKKLPELLINVIKKKLGPIGEMVIPTFSLNSKKVIELDTVSKVDNGILAEYYFKYYNVKRSNSIFHSHIGDGKMFLNHCRLSKSFSFGNNSDFDFFKKKNYKILSIGLEPEYFLTYLHHIEQLKKVNYRKWIILNKVIKKKFKKKKIKIKYFARKSNKSYLNLNMLFNKYLKKKVTYKYCKLKYGNSYLLKVSELHQVLTKYFN